MKKLMVIFVACSFLSGAPVCAEDSCMPTSGKYFMRARVVSGTCKPFKGVVDLADVKNDLVQCTGEYTVIETPMECGWKMNLSCMDYDPATKAPLGKVVQKGKVLRQNSRTLKGTLELTALTVEGALLCRSVYDVTYQKL